MTYRVVQWNTGNVGKQALKAIIESPLYKLVGCYAWSEDKAGRDAGELAGVAPIGLAATGDTDALLALKPDCINFNSVWPDVALWERILEAGINITTTSAFITGHSLGESDRQRLEAACQRGTSSMFGSGINPGLANLLGLVSAGICSRVDAITVTESVDATGYGSADTEASVGYGSPTDEPGLEAKAKQGMAVFEDSVHLMADALGIDLDEVTFNADFAAATEDLDLGYMRIEKGCVAGIEGSWQGWLSGRVVINLKTRWRKGKHLEPDWPVEHGYIVEIQGMPCVKTKLEIWPPADFVAKTFEDYMQLGMIMTAMPAVNAIPAVCEAGAGIKTYADLPLITARGSVS